MVLKFNVGVAMLIALAVVYPICSTMTIVTFSDAFTTDPNSMSIPSVAKTKTETVTKYHKVRQDWNDQSLKYYSKIMQEERRRKSGEIDCDVLASKEYQEEFERMAKKHYFALTKIKEGRYDHAEIIYERIIREIMKEGEDGTSCDHAKLAVTTLLLALHCQRMGEVRKTRLVFVNFFGKSSFRGNRERPGNMTTTSTNNALVPPRFWVPLHFLK